MSDSREAARTKNEEPRTKNCRNAAPYFNLNSQLQLKKTPARNTAGFFYLSSTT